MSVFCAACGNTFADEWAWCAHKPWVTRESRGSCRFGRNLYDGVDGWTLRPNWGQAVKEAEEGEAEHYLIRHPESGKLIRPRK